MPKVLPYKVRDGVKLHLLRPGEKLARRVGKYLVYRKLFEKAVAGAMVLFDNGSASRDESVATGLGPRRDTEADILPLR
ncbi:MAG: hypothetical protein ACREVH_13310 [Gammaproteobacteria bacterium]